MTTKPRTFAAALAIGAAVVLGTSGCSMISSQATTISYSAAEGVNVPESGPLKVRNAFIVANADGSEGNLVAGIVNPTDEPQTLRIELGEGSSTIELSVRVPANSVVSLGSENTEPLLVEGLDTPPGADIPGYFQSGDSEGALISVPVLDGTLDYLADLVP